MLDHATFLRAIGDNPADDGPRLVYADWLEEQGETARAEFIRVQCELARLAPRRRGRGRLRDRQKRLLATHRHEWLGDVCAMVRVVGALSDETRWESLYVSGRDAVVAFERGFVELVDMPVETFVQHSAKILRAASPGDLRITGQLHRYTARSQGNRLAAILACELRGIRPHSLGLTFCPMATKSWRTLLRSGGLSRLRRLKLAACALGNEILPAIASSRRLAALEELHIASNPITDEGLFALAESSRLGELRVLRINESRYYEAYSLAGLIELAESPRLPKLAEIHVAGNIREPQVDFFHRRFGRRVRLIADADDIPF